jgi:hypothetical protein
MSRCSACGRPLSRPSPSGLGPVCARRLGITPARRPARLRRPVVRPVDAPPEPIPGQVEIPLTHFQPTLEAL